jgi:hypothetical protein
MNPIYGVETASATAKIRNCEPRFTLMDAPEIAKSSRLSGADRWYT